jgi:hypothetical protein
MDAKPAFGFKELFTHIVGDMAKAICARNGEAEGQKFSRSEAAVHMIMAFLPRDVIEAMLAGHCVMIHELIVDGVRHTLLGEIDTMRRASRAGIVALDKTFGNNLTRLERYQLRPAQGQRDAMPAEVAAAVAAQEPVTAPVPQAAEAQAAGQTLPAAVREEFHAAGTQAAARPARVAPPLTPMPMSPTAAAIAACKNNPEAMAALDAGDPVRFARAMGLEQPGEAFLAAAAAPGSPFHRPMPATEAAQVDADAATGD